MITMIGIIVIMLIILSDRLIVLTGLLTCGRTNTPSCRQLAAEIAQFMDALGDKFRPAMSTGWLKYIQTAYAVGPASAAASSTGQGTLIVPDDE
jgi:hypothetical protein